MTHARIESLLDLMSRLRSPDRGCPWDLEQTFETIAPYTIEEAYEVDDAIRRKDWSDLRDELGDLLLQVVFHSQIARESGRFTFDDVVDGLSEKLVRRHPHVFGDASAEDADEVLRAWEVHKRAERVARGGDPHGEVPLALPALLRAAKLARRAKRAGADRADAGAGADADPLVARLLPELAGADPARVGDFLFALAATLSARGLDPEGELREACARFETRAKSERR